MQCLYFNPLDAAMMHHTVYSPFYFADRNKLISHTKELRVEVDQFMA